MRLPRRLIEDGLEQDVLSVLQEHCVPLYEGGEIRVPLLKLTSELRKHLFYAKSQGELIFGYEDIKKVLTNELQGLRKVDNQSDRISRFMLVTNDGSERFYKELEFLAVQQGNRVLFAKLDIDSLLMAEILNQKGKIIKAVLLTRKRSLIHVLKSLPV